MTLAVVAHEAIGFGIVRTIMGHASADVTAAITIGGVAIIHAVIVSIPVIVAVVVTAIVAAEPDAERDTTPTPAAMATPAASTPAMSPTPYAAMHSMAEEKSRMTAEGDGLDG